ncbi:MAG: Lysine--tRNA ligase, heat inducible [Acidimicrobiales bacterium AG-410-I20]|nr:MAG: Lysine--tRNA ligase, heat inducible [Acidimicrobiales bacterium AG-410-I20]
MAESTIPYRFDPSHSIEEIRETHSDIEDGSETGIQVVVAGRLMLKRDQGKIVFGTLQDSTGRIQLFAPEKTTPNFTELTDLHLGDWLGVTGEIIKTRKGELSVKVSEWVRLAEARRPFPDKWHGISDTDMRYRQRYVDLWVTEETRQTFLIRSRVISLTRHWLEKNGFIEVETPVFHPIPGGALARPFITHHNALDVDLYLRIAPELYLKRLVVGGFEKVYEIARVFRNEGLSTRHNPEFTMLELYQAYADYTDIMEMVEKLMEYLALEILGTTVLTHGDRSFDLKAPWRRASMLELLSEYASIEVDLDTPRSELVELCDKHEVPIKDHYGPGKIILELYEKTVEPNLWDPIFVTDYPKEVSPLSRDHRESPGWVERFEAIVAGRELCNAFTELIDPEEQRSRFLGQEEEKAAGDDEAMVVDEDYLRSLEYGLPPTAGIGIGIDRLVMLLTGDTAIRDVILFPTLRPEQGLSD